MGPRNWIGLGMILTGIALQPVGWMYFFWAQILSVVLIFIGVFVVAAHKYLDRSVEKEFSPGKGGGRGMPGDVHDHSGWGRGGRSESWTSEHIGNGDGSGD